LLALSSACVAYSATPATQGQAFVVIGGPFGSDLYFCDATAGEPECWAVVEKEVKQ
jgi:hypothetical protein